MNTNQDQDTVEEGRARLGQVFRYLKALHEQRYPPVRSISQHPFSRALKDIPNHEYVEVDSDDAVLRIRRPVLTVCPSPPEVIRLWIFKGWEQPTDEPRHLDSRPISGDDESEAFERDQDRVSAWNAWEIEWRRWAAIARVERQVERIYQELYEQYSILERDGERYELLIGDGIATWSLPEGLITHPVLLKSLELVFDAAKAEFMLIEGQRPVEFYSVPLRSTEVDPKVLAKVRDQIDRSPDIHPLEKEATDDFLRGLAASLDKDGKLFDTPVPVATKSLSVYRNPVILRRLKVAGIGAAIDQVLEVLTQDRDVEDSAWEANLPEGLMRVVGIETRSKAWEKGVGVGPTDPEEDEDTYFTKPANVEQHRIVRKLNSTGCVLVQGPPGTGKTHTIGNLIGHLLAQGKSVLVTSHTTKALTVVRDQVVETLQPLCVSVLENERENRDRLEGSVQKIAEKLTEDGGELPKRAEDLRAVRLQLIGEIRGLKARLRSARRSEYELVTINGETFKPVEAAKLLSAGLDKDDWIPGSIAQGASAPLSPEELLDLYESNEKVSLEDEANHPEDFPNISGLIDSDTFADILASAARLRPLDLSLDTMIVAGGGSEALPQIKHAVTVITEAISFLTGEDSQWKRMVVELSRRGQGNIWEQLTADVERIVRLATATTQRTLRIAPVWSAGIDSRAAILVCREIEEFLESGKKLTTMKLLVKRQWKSVVENLKVADGDPSTVEHFAVGREDLELARERETLVRVWNGMLGEVGGPLIEPGNGRPELFMQPLIPDLRSCVAWHDNQWPKVEKAAIACSLSVKAASLRVPAPNTQSAEIDRLTAALRDQVLPILNKMQTRIELGQIEHRLEVYKSTTASLAKSFPVLPLVQRLAQCVAEEDELGYAETLRALRDVQGKASLISRRRELLRRLSASAPEWSQAIQLREGTHGKRKVPDHIGRAWRWKQLQQELSHRSKVSIQDLMDQLALARTECERTTAHLVETLAWSNQFGRVTLKMRQNLMGYVETLRRIGKGTGRRVPRLLIDAQRQMSESQGAVPVWIMPLNRVVESFDLRKVRFDVVIVDESSQLDLTGLIALFMARQVVIVGDHEQVEPLAVGQKLDDAQALIDEMLDGIPNGHLWDGKQSVYSLAKSAFEPIALKEHFRCVPQIIGFSNRLSYRGEILPLREDSGVVTRPFVVDYYVPGSYLEGRVNRREAETLVALMKAAIEQTEYDHKSFGVINLVGDDDSDQARLVYALARTHIGEIELESRRFRCGNSAQFQGDERHVMFLSVVDVPRDGVLPKRTEELFKKRSNVAASRAKDQMWVIYSLDPDTQLQAGDLRRDLIEFARDPDALDKLYEDKVADTESDFEEKVLRHLLNEGYRNVQPQYRAGAYRIDFVVKHGNRRIAIECDGDKFHGLDQLDADMSRQATLERLGWKFVRIRGSEFYRDQARAMDRVFRELTELGIPRNLTLGFEQEEVASSDLLERVKHRAAQLLRTWRGEDFQVEADDRIQPEMLIPGTTEVIEISQIDSQEEASNETFTADEKPLTVERGLFDDETQGEFRSDTTATSQDQFESAREIIHRVLKQKHKFEREELLRICAPVLTGRPLDKHSRSVLNKTLFREIQAGRLKVDKAWVTVERVG